MNKSRTCESCVHSRWELTPTGMIKKYEPGWCHSPLPQLPPVPICTSIEIMSRKSIWPDYKDCPVWKENDGPLKQKGGVE